MAANRVAWLSPGDPETAFPNVDSALREPDGLLAAGGDLSTKRLLYAYRQGIFPWYDDGQPILWWSPDPRCVLRPADFHISKRLRRDLAQSKGIITLNRSFSEVIRACAEPRPHQQGTWITADMVRAFETLHAAGWAHSIEVRSGDCLVGGMYGLAIGGVFFGESMFSRQSNASKFALCGLSNLLLKRGFELIDCQVVSEHLMTLGATTMPRAQFTEILRRACDPARPLENWPDGPISIRELSRS